jgi:hypothetical protein
MKKVSRGRFYKLKEEQKRVSDEQGYRVVIFRLAGMVIVSIM